MRTISRAKLPRTHTYPLGLEQLATALKPECGEADVIFECYAVGLQAQGHDYRVLTFGHDESNIPVVKVAAVRRELKAHVRKLILEKALPEVRRMVSELALGTRIEFHFSEAEGHLRGPRLVGIAEVPTIARRRK